MYGSHLLVLAEPANLITVYENTCRPRPEEQTMYFIAKAEAAEYSIVTRKYQFSVPHRKL